MYLRYTQSGVIKEPKQGKLRHNGPLCVIAGREPKIIIILVLNRSLKKQRRDILHKQKKKDSGFYPLPLTILFQASEVFLKLKRYPTLKPEIER